MAFDWSDPVWTLIVLLIAAAVFVASFRRSRILSGYPVWRSVLTGLLAAWFWPIWILLSVVNFRQVADEWDAARARRRTAKNDPTVPSPR